MEVTQCFGCHDVLPRVCVCGWVGGYVQYVGILNYVQYVGILN